MINYWITTGEDVGISLVHETNYTQQKLSLMNERICPFNISHNQHNIKEGIKLTIRNAIEYISGGIKKMRLQLLMVGKKIVVFFIV